MVLAKDQKSSMLHLTIPSRNSCVQEKKKERKKPLGSRYGTGVISDSEKGGQNSYLHGVDSLAKEETKYLKLMLIVKEEARGQQKHIESVVSWEVDQE